MSATIPIWCAVLNWLLFDEAIEESRLAPPWMPPPQAYALAEATRRIVTDLKEDTRKLISSALRGTVVLPLRLVWAAPVDGAIEWFGDFAEALVCEPDEVRRRCTPLALLSCSADLSEDAHRELHSWGYVKGAGDDEEHWSCGLTADIFWRHAERILAGRTDEDVSRIVQEVLTDEARALSVPSSDTAQSVGIHRDLKVRQIGNSGVYLALFSSAVLGGHSIPDVSFDSVLLLRSAAASSVGPMFSSALGVSAPVTEIMIEDESERGIKGNDWRQVISEALQVYERLLSSGAASDGTPRVLVAGSGACFSHALAALAILVAHMTYSSDEAQFRVHRCGENNASKASIRLIVSLLQASCPSIHLPRALVKELTTYFLSPPKADHRGRRSDEATEQAAAAADASSISGLVSEEQQKG
jgi:hypothetical protein